MRLVSAIISLLFFVYAHGEIQKHGPILMNPGTLTVMWVSTMFAPDDAPAILPPGNGRSQVDFDLQFYPSQAEKDKTTYAVNTGLTTVRLQLVLMRGSDLSQVGMSKDILCCNPDIPECEQSEDTVYISNKARKEWGVDVRDIEVTYDPNDPSIESGTIESGTMGPVAQTGRYLLFVAHCDRTASTSNVDSVSGLVEGYGVAVTVSGRSAWINPYGYLPGHLYGYMPMHGLLAIAYLAIVVGWLLNILVYRAETIRVHKFFSLLLLLCVAESGVCYGDYLWYNSTGFAADTPMYVCVGTKVLHQAFTRALLVALALGYGVTTPTIAGHKLPLNALTAVYVAVVAAREFLTRFSDVATLRTAPVVLVLSLLAALLEAAYFSWVYSALSDTIGRLRDAAQELKLRLYHRFAGILAAAGAAVLAFMCYAFVTRIGEFEPRQWDRWWFVDVGFWQVLYLGVIAAVAILWRPSEVSRHYAYQELLDLDQEEQKANTSADTVEEGLGSAHSWAAGDDCDTETELQQLGAAALSEDEALSDY